MNDDAPLQVKSSEVPQANSLDRLRQLVEAVRRGSTQKREIQAATGLSSRHADYYGQAARTLGWVDRDGESYSLAQGATALLGTRPGSDEERDAFVRAIEACEIVQALAPDLLADPGPTEDELTRRIQAATDLAQKTARRRAQALLTWRARVVVTQAEPDQDLVPLLIDDDGESERLGSLVPRFDAITVERFKGVRRASLELTGLTLLVGPHGVGKSSLRDVFRFLHGLGRTYSLAQIAGEHWGEAGTLAWSGIRGGPRELPYLGQDTFSIAVQVAVPDGNQLRPADYAIEVMVGEGCAPRVVRERLSFEGRGTFVFDSHPEVDAPVQVPDRLAVRLGRASRTGARGPTLLVDPRRPALSQLAMHPAVRTRAVTDAAASVLSAFRSLRFLEPSSEAMRRATFPHQLVLGDRGENLSSVLHGVCQDPERRDLLFRNLRSFTDGLMSEIQFLPDATGRLLLAVVDRNGARLSAPSVSEGVLRFLTVMAALLGFESPGFWFMDNIDAGFSPSKLGLVLELLEHQAAASMRQLVVTLRDEDAVGALDLAPDGITSAYQMYAHGWREPERLGSAVEEPAPRRPRNVRRDEDDPNELLPF